PGSLRGYGQSRPLHPVPPRRSSDLRRRVSPTIRTARAGELTNRIVELLRSVDVGVEEEDRLLVPPEVLLASYGVGCYASEPIRPETPLRDTVLFTNAASEPNLASEIGREMASADRVDALIAFVKWSGLRLLADRISEFLSEGKPLRVIT